MATIWLSGFWILGHNGSGKSTLAKTFNAVLLPAGGKVYVEGMDTLDQDLLLAIRQRVGAGHLAEHLLRRSVQVHPAVVHHHNAVRVLRLVHVVGNQDDRDVLFPI